MTTSGTTVFSLTRDQLITAAVRKTGRLASGQSLSAQQLSDGQQALNGIIALLQTKGMPLWARAEYTFSTTLATSSYTIGVGQTLDTPYPVKIHQAFAINTVASPNTGTEMEILSTYDLSLSVVSSTGPLPTQLSYQPKVDLGIITIWPIPDSTAASDIDIKIIYSRPFEMFTSGTETLDIPREHHMPIIYNLAVALAPEYGVPLQDRQMLMKEAMTYQDAVDSFGQEDGSLYFTARKY